MNAFFDWLHDAAERALPVVCAFGLGVVIAVDAGEAERNALRDAVRALADQVEHTRIACGAQPDPDAVSVFVAAAPADVARLARLLGVPGCQLASGVAA